MSAPAAMPGRFAFYRGVTPLGRKTMADPAVIYIFFVAGVLAAILAVWDTFKRPF